MDEDRIVVLNRVTFKPPKGRRLKGTVVEIRRGIYLVKTRKGLYFPVRARDITKECR